MKLARRTAEVEETVLGAHADTLAGALPGRHALLAVGGFGRRELFPCSDVDLLLLVEFEPNLELVRERLSRFLKTLWDAHLRPSHSVRTAEECLTLDPRNVELSVSLLDRRFRQRADAHDR